MRLVFRCTQRLQGLLSISDASCSIHRHNSVSVDSTGIPASRSLRKGIVFFLPPTNTDTLNDGRLSSYLAKGSIQLRMHAPATSAVQVSFLIDPYKGYRRMHKDNELRVHFLNDFEVDVKFDVDQSCRSKKARLANLLSSPTRIVLDDFRVLTTRQIKHALLEDRFCLIELDVRGGWYLPYLILAQPLFSGSKFLVADWIVLSFIFLFAMKLVAERYS